uniref:Uncharacterized protein n=1 Tax=Vespula pensylvanica TaxID=30213 RepID=A0A834JL05_VESPE|nr:hypothetical protein H0235_017603 [Vespula pensylvanica]
MDYFLRNQLIWNIIYEILDNWRYNCSYRRIQSVVVDGSAKNLTSSASKISPQFYDYLFTASNITASYEAYSADKSLSLYLSGLKKPLDVALSEGKHGKEKKHLQEALRSFQRRDNLRMYDAVLLEKEISKRVYLDITKQCTPKEYYTSDFLTYYFWDLSKIVISLNKEI